MFILLILILFAATGHTDGLSNAAEVFFSIGPFVTEIDCIVKNWWNYKKVAKFKEKSTL